MSRYKYVKRKSWPYSFPVFPGHPLLPPSLGRARVELEKIQKVGQENKHIKQLACTEEKNVLQLFKPREGLLRGLYHYECLEKRSRVLPASSNKSIKKQQVNLTSSKHTVKLRNSLPQDAIGHQNSAHVQSATEHVPGEKPIKGSEDTASLPQ